MKISKGPFKPVHQNKALTLVVHARLLNQLSIQQMKTFYVAFLNLECYLNKLMQPVITKIIKPIRKKTSNRVKRTKSKAKICKVKIAA